MGKLLLMKKWAIAILALTILGCGGGTGDFVSTGNPPPGLGGPEIKRGDLVSFTLLRDFGSASMNTVLSYIQYQSGISMSVTSDVSLYKVTYWTVDLTGKLVKATGAVAIPDTPTNPALVAYQHSTVTSRTNVPSANNDEGWAVLAIFAATGNYVVSMADYLGLGDSPGFHPYMIAQSEADTSLDMMRAARELCKKQSVTLSKKLFLSGYSQGGHATMALARLIEGSYASEFPLTAVGPGAGPYDLSDTELNFAFNSPGPDTPTFLAYLVLAYREYYSILPDLTKVFKSPWDQKAPPLFDGNHDIDGIAKVLPHALNDLFTSEFINDTLHNIGVPLKDRLQENDDWQWVPRTQMTLFHASSDNIVSFQNSQKAYDYMHEHGAPVTLVDLGNNMDHLGGFYYAIPKARLWFDTFNSSTNQIARTSPNVSLH